MLVDTYTTWAIRKVGEPFGFVKKDKEIYLTDKKTAEGYNHMGFEAVEMHVEIRINQQEI